MHRHGMDGWALLVLLGVAGSAAAGPRLQGPERWDAPAIGRQQPHVQTFAFRNEGDAPLEITSVTATDPAIEVHFDPMVLPPQGKGSLRVVLDGKNLPEEYRHSVLLRTNQPDRPIWTLDMVGEVLGPRTSVDEGEYYVGSVAPGQVVEHTFKIRNTGAELLTIESLEPSHPSLTATARSTRIGPGEETAVAVRWQVPAEEGSFHESVLVTTNDPDPRQSGIQLRIEGRVSALLGQGDLDIPEDAPPVTLRFFFTPGCSVCERVQRTVLAHVAERFGPKVKVEYYNLRTDRGFELLLQLSEQYNLQADGPVYVFIGDRALVGGSQIEDELEAAVVHFLRNPVQEKDPAATGPATGAEGETSLTERRFLSFTPWVIAANGLMDGINPCAFATIVFFISFLTYLGRGRRDMMLVGLCFTGAVFFTYLAVGIGALTALKEALTRVHWLSQAVSWAAIVLLVGLAVYSLRDAAIVWATGRTRDMALQLPDSIKRRIHAVIRARLGATSLASGALATGFLVTLLETVCTGQIYFPTILIILKDPEHQTRAFLYLLLYNLMFITPLVAVFLLSYFGTTSKRLGEWGQRNVVPVKILLSLVFLVMAFLLLKTLV